MSSLKIALFGYGKMGRLIDRLATERGDRIVHRIGAKQREALRPDELSEVDVIIDFSRPEAAVDNIRFALSAQTPIVVGTTGWLDRLSELSREVEELEGSLFWAANFSVGVHLFFATARELARRFADRPDYRCSIEETHHTTKLDAPSGTALRLQQYVTEELGGGAPPITAHREAGVAGTHRLRFASTIDTVELSHEAHSREGFARGALRAAHWLPGRRGVFTMSDLL
jgi:4-hydroxy-tetrahydrodipicolinate reductase